MSKFNKKIIFMDKLASRDDAVRNHENALAFKLDNLADLYIKVASCLVGAPKFYQSADQADSELIKSIHTVLEINPEFVLQLAVYAREELHLRSVPLVLCAEYANVAPGTVPYARKYIARVIQRVDEITELLGYQFARNKYVPRKSKLPQVIKHAVGDSFNKFGEYQFGKYNRSGEVTLKDALFLTHPAPFSEHQQELFDDIVNDDLVSPVTWETQRSSGILDWAGVIRHVFNKNGRVNNYMAQLRNLRNCMLDASVMPGDIDLLCSMISDEQAVKSSKQMPFRYLSAYNVVNDIADSPYCNQVIDALEQAVQHSASNIPTMIGTTLLACDVSASMYDKISERSNIRQYDIGLMLASMSHMFCEKSITGIFGDIWKPVPLSKYSGILANVDAMYRCWGQVGYSTYGHSVIDYLLGNSIMVDRIMMFTDNQMWNSGSDAHIAERFIQYQRINPDVKLYLFDLSGYGTISIPRDTKNVFLIGGWSDRIFDFVKQFESGGASVIETIGAIKPGSFLGD